ncbi:MAG: hypothetical protein MHPSP_002016, partial [Paramarteilia canceri]
MSATRNVRDQYEQYLHLEFNQLAKSANQNMKNLKNKYANLLKKEIASDFNQQSEKTLNHFRRIVEQKKEIIETLISKMNFDQEQNNQFEHRHVQKTEEIQQFYQKNLSENLNMYLHEVGFLHNKFLLFKKQIDNERHQSTERLHTVEFSVQNQARNDSLNSKINFRGRKDELKNK